MQHHFDVEVAKEFGILEAVLLENISFWLAKNAANETNYYDGDYWTYNSIRAFAKLFPYATERQIKYALNKLKDAGVIKTASYNQNAYDHTLWYGLTEKGKSIVSNEKIDLTAMSNRKTHSVQPIPYNKPDNKQHISTNTNVLVEAKPQEYGNSQINELFDKWEECCGFRVDTKIKANRYACNRLIKSRGFDKVINSLPYVAESQMDKFAPKVTNFMDLAEKWNDLAVWYKKKIATSEMKHGTIVIPDQTKG